MVLKLVAALMISATMAFAFAPLQAGAQPVSAPFKTELESLAALFVIDQFLDAENDLEQIREFYGESVFYFREGVQSRAQVLRDKKAYLLRWPQRRFAPDLDTLKTRVVKGPDGGESVEVSLEVDFEVSGERSRAAERRAARDITEGALSPQAPTRVSRGRSLVVVRVAQQGGRFLVLSEGGRVIKRLP